MIKLIKSTFYKEKEAKAELLKFIDSAQILSFGPECIKFENNFAKYQGRKYCVFFNSGSSANLALMQALQNLGKIKRKDMVGFSALTWATNVMPIMQLNLKPIPVDVELNTLNVSSKKLLRVAEKYPLKIMFLTNLLGFCDDLENIKNICDSKNIILVEDNCESLGTEYKGKKLGNYGLASTFSFFVGHHMSTIEGGAVCTDDKDLSNMLKMVRAHGWDRHLDKGEQKNLMHEHNISEFYKNYTFYDLAYNFRPTEINGFLGNNQVKYLDEIVRKRRDNFLELAQTIYENKKYFMPIKYKHLDMASNFAFPVICRSADIRDKIVKKIRNKLETRPIVGGNILFQPFFKKYFLYHLGLEKLFNCPNSELIHRQGFYFGNNPEITAQEIKSIKSIFSKIKI